MGTSLPGTLGTAANGSLAATGYGQAGPYGTYWQGGTTSFYEYASTTWLSGTIAVNAGDQIYFITDPGHGQTGSHGNHPFGGASDLGTIAAVVNFTATPEPSSIVLLGIAGVGFALAAWKRRRSASGTVSH
jgi:hypothetical protein